MSVLVTDAGFVPDDFTGQFAPVDEGTDCPLLAPDFDPAKIADLVAKKPAAIAVDFPAFSDGRGFTLGQMIRRAGYNGRLRAHGHVIADQYAMARRVGFDEVEISDALAERQPADQWLFRADWKAHDYQSRMRG